jgi:tyrosinase
MTDNKYAEHRDLFLRGFTNVQQKKFSDPTSFYQIAGIHGLPYEPYDGVLGTYNENSEDQWGGYCHHGDILFPTWHRPYIMLLEQCIYNEAKNLIGR